MSSSSKLSTFVRRLLLNAAILLLLTGCIQDSKAAPAPTSTVNVIGDPNPTTRPSTITPLPTASSIAQLQVQDAKTVAPTVTKLSPPSTNTPLPSVTPDPTIDPYADLFIENLAQRKYGGGELEIVETLSSNDLFTRYLITYPSDGLTVYGFMNVPIEGQKFPVAIVIHGYIPPSEYNTLTYTTRYADSLVEAGYLVIHPNLRNHPPSDSGPDPFRIGYATDILNLIAVIREQSQDPDGYLRRADPDDINLWGHSMGGGIVLRTIAVNTDPYIRGAILYAAMSGDEKANFEKILEWSSGIEGSFELAVPEETLQKISPVNYLDRIQAPISIHHSDSDQQVPPEWSADLCQQLQASNHEIECFTYEGLTHTFSGSGDSLFMERVIDFFNRQ